MMGYVVKIVRDVANTKDDVYIDGVLSLSSPWFPDFNSPYVPINADFEFYSMNNMVELNYLGAVETDIKNYQFDLGNLFDTVVIPDALSFECWNSSYTNSLFYVIKNQYGTYSSLRELHMTFNHTTAVATGLTYISGSASTTCDLTSLMAEFELLKAQNLEIINLLGLVNPELDLRLADLDDATELINSKLDTVLTIAPAIPTLATKEDLLPLATQYTTNNFIEDNRVILHQLLLNTATKTDLEGITIDTTNLATKTDIELLSSDISHIVLPSLNGNGTEFKDGSSVTVNGRETVYNVERSYHSLYADNGYTVHYDLVSVDGYRCTVPEALLTKYIPVV